MLSNNNLFVQRPGNGATMRMDEHQGSPQKQGISANSRKRVHHGDMIMQLPPPASIFPPVCKRRQVNIIHENNVQFIPFKKANWWKLGGYMIQKQMIKNNGLEERRPVTISCDSLSSNAVTTIHSQLQEHKRPMRNAIIGPSGVVTSDSQPIQNHRPFVNSSAALPHVLAQQIMPATFHNLPSNTGNSAKSSLATINSTLALFQERTSQPALQQQQQHRQCRPTEDEDNQSNDGTAASVDSTLKFRAYQAENWTEKFEELMEFRNQYGHCLVPNSFPENPSLAQWVKRQRYQYKLKLDDKRSTMSEERIQALEELGFVWDSHSAVWDERLQELREYKQLNGHCNVPSRHTENRQLSVWVKRQRRQYKFYVEDNPSSMTQERIYRLEATGFEWDLRKRRNADSDDQCRQPGTRKLPS